MSGIVGIFRVDGSDSQESDVLKMMDAMPHRGPDGRGSWAEGSSALGHLLLRTTPESMNEAQPLALSSCVLVADARIDNRSELISRLDLSSDATDSDLILHAYLNWGDDCVQHLIGDFAFAISDQQNNRLFCARDHFGLRPFYYHHLPGRRIAFATEIKALLRVEGVPGRMNEQRVVDYLTAVRNDTRSTIYKEIFRLPPAHTLVFDANGLQISRYWTLKPAEIPEYETDEEYTEHFRQLFAEAVRCRSRSLGPVGSELSGGLDSAYVSCVARNEVHRSSGAEKVHAFSVVFDESPECDEREYIQPVLDQGGFEAHLISGDHVGPLTHLDEVYGGALDDFLVGGNYTLKWLIYREARDAGVRVVLNGTDGDTVVQHGSMYLKELAEEGNWAELSRQIAALSQVYGEADHTQPFQEEFASQWKLFHRYVTAHLGELARDGRYIDFVRGLNSVPGPFNVTRRYLLKRLWRELIVPSAWRRGPETASHLKLSKLVNQETVHRFNLIERLEEYRASEERLFGSVREKARITLQRARLAGGFEAANHMAAWFGSEPRYPFMDIRLVQFCLALPPEQSLSMGWTRAIMRRAMEGVVPDKVRYRIGKGRLYEAFRRGLLKIDAKKLNYHVTTTGALATYVNTDYLNELKTHRDELDSTDLVLLSRAAILSNWLKLKFPNSLEEDEEAPPISDPRADSRRNFQNPGELDEKIAILRSSTWI